MSLLRPRLPTPSTLPIPKTIVVLHPDYPDGKNNLIGLPANDDGGIHYDTVLVACQILANNRWDGYFARKTAAPAAAAPVFERVERPADNMLRGHEHYFCLPDRPAPNPDSPYPIVVTFTDWRFPHSGMPSIWSDVDLNPGHLGAGVEERSMPTEGCCITACGDATEKSHVVHRNLGDWFNVNHMRSYAPRSSMTTQQINSPANIVCMRKDLHALFDRGVFTFVPKEGHLALHIFLSTPSQQLESTYHNRVLCPLTLTSREYLFARFAWTILSYGLMGEFLEEGLPDHRVILRWDPQRMMHAAEVIDQEKCRTVLYAKRAKSSSRSPSEKRPAESGSAQGRGTSANADAGTDADTNTDGPRTDEESSAENSFATEEEDSDTEDSPPRGRSRKRAIDCINSAEAYVNVQRARMVPV